MPDCRKPGINLGSLVSYSNDKISPKGYASRRCYFPKLSFDEQCPFCGTQVSKVFQLSSWPLLVILDSFDSFNTVLVLPFLNLLLNFSLLQHLSLVFVNYFPLISLLDYFVFLFHNAYQTNIRSSSLLKRSLS